MCSTTNTPSSLWRFSWVARSFLSQPGLPFASSLSEERLERAFAAESDDTEESSRDAEDKVYTPAVTLWAFLSQMLHAEEQRSCVAAVARVAVLWLSLGQRVCASNSGAYCRARARRNAAVIERLAREVADDCERDAPEAGSGAAGACCWETAPRSACPTRRRIKRRIRSTTCRNQDWGFPWRGWWCCFLWRPVCCARWPWGPIPARKPANLLCGATCSRNSQRATCSWRTVVMRVGS